MGCTGISLLFATLADDLPSLLEDDVHDHARGNVFTIVTTDTTSILLPAATTLQREVAAL